MNIEQLKLNTEITDKYSITNNTFIGVAKDNPKDKIDIEIGDSKQTDFYPQVKIQRWDNEVNLSYRLKHDEKNPVITTEADKIKWQGNKIECHFYDINNEEHPEGASEFEVILKEKPKTNVVEFSLNTKGLEFFYQPALTQEEIDQGANRPDNVIGSYAVYASEQKTNYVGGKEYKCGKVGHIYRPRIEDSIGNWVWGELKIDTKLGILSVAIPQEFLDNAVYPVKHAAGLTFGYTSIGVNEDIIETGNYIVAFVVTGSEGNGNNISLYTSTRPSGIQLKYAIYQVSSPYSKIAETSELTENPAAAGWKTIDFTSSPSFTSQNYYLCYLSNTSQSVVNRYDTASQNSYFKSNTYSNGFPSTLTGLSSNRTTRKYSIYATYTAVIASTLKNIPTLLTLGVG